MKKVVPTLIVIAFLLIGSTYALHLWHSRGKEESASNENPVWSSNNGEEDSNEDSSSQSNVTSDSNSQENSNSQSNSGSNSQGNSSSNSSGNSNKNPSNPTTPEPTDNRTVGQKVDDAMKSLSLEEKIAQMLIISYSGTTMSSGLKTMLNTYHPGGFILFANNISTYQNTSKLISDIQSTAEIPMFISIDQEGGTVQRLTNLTSPKATYIPSMTLLGKTKNSQLAHDVGVVMAQELRTLGINMDFAPVIDVMNDAKTSFMKNRSFGTDPKVVADMGVSLAKGFQENGVIPVYKHFPGHGGTSVDSHYDLPVLTKKKEALYKIDLVPFQKAIESNADVIMIGHLSIPNVDPKYPSSLSKTIVTDILKKELGYKGLVITDALNMGALTKTYTERQIYELAINAGVDILLMPKNPANAIRYIKESIQAGTISESQINESVRKILTLKYTRIQEKNLSKNLLGSAEHQAIINKIPKS